MSDVPRLSDMEIEKFYKGMTALVEKRSKTKANGERKAKTIANYQALILDIKHIIERNKVKPSHIVSLARISSAIKNFEEKL